MSRYCDGVRAPGACVIEPRTRPADEPRPEQDRDAGQEQSYTEDGVQDCHGMLFERSNPAHHEHGRDAHEFDELAVGNRAEQADPILKSKFCDQLLEPWPLAALAYDPDLEIAVRCRAYQHVEPLVRDEPTAGED